MRLMFVNHAHPQIRHISGVRLWRFAEELARRGHRVLHVTATLPQEGEGAAPPAAPARMRDHDWGRPCHLAIRPAARPLLAAARAGRLPALLRRALTAYAIIGKGGVFYDWTDAVRAQMPAVLDEFKPQLVWGTFGNSSNVHLARAAARAAGAALAVDIKDTPSGFLPAGTQQVVAGRMREARVLTANARALEQDAERFCGLRAEVIYSGVDAAFFEPVGEAATPASETGTAPLRVTLTGSVYSVARLREFLGAFDAWRHSVLERSARPVSLVYVGGEHAKVAAWRDEATAGSWLECHPYLALPELAAICRSAAINAYIKGSPFHHKLLELLAAGKPVIAFGGESEESFELAAQAGGSLSAPADAEGLRAALEQAAAQPAHAQWTGAAQFGWPAQAERLERVFAHIIGEE